MTNALQLHVQGVRTPQEAERYVVRIRFAQALARQTALDGGDDESVHAFRLACKRVRFALERLDAPPPQLRRAQTLLSKICDELGWAHDCAQLAMLARDCGAPLAAVRAERDRDRYAVRAARLWRDAFSNDGDFRALAEYAGFLWSVA